MSRKLLAFLLSELETIRVICQRCKGIAEMPVAEIAECYKTADTPPKCPFCDHVFVGVYAMHKGNKLVKLAEAIIELRDLKDGIEIEFVLPDASSITS